jgi:DNA polymerase III delta prime subunit
MFGLSRIHHAYFIEGGDFEYIADELKKINFIVQANPDFWHLDTENLTIDDARIIKDLQSQRPIAGDRRVFVVENFAMTGEAQNALLKVFEEPTAGALFIVISPSAHILLPTLRSRMVVISVEKKKALSPIDPKVFIASAAAKRIEMLKPILESKDAEGNKRADKKAAAAFLSALRQEIGNGDAIGLTATDEALIYLFDRSSSVKILLENVSMSVCTAPELSKTR